MLACNTLQNNFITALINFSIHWRISIRKPSGKHGSPSSYMLYIIIDAIMTTSNKYKGMEKNDDTYHSMTLWWWRALIISLRIFSLLEHEKGHQVCVNENCVVRSCFVDVCICLKMMLMTFFGRNTIYI